jgi:spore maturation protein CgeB
VRIVVLGLSITSSWGNGHATNYRALLEALVLRGHDVLFLERDVEWYAATRDFAAPYVRLYRTLDDLRDQHADDVRGADLVLVGSYVPDGVEVGEWAVENASGLVAFWDIDTPVTAGKLAAGDHEYLSPELLQAYDLYLSFTSGPLLEDLGARRPRAFHCMVDPHVYRPLVAIKPFALGYLGTYSLDRQATLDRLLLGPARALSERRFAVGGPQYPDTGSWPQNVVHVEHIPPAQHPAFYASHRLTLNVTRRAMVDAGWSPSVRLFEAAACGVPVLSDWWPGLDEFFCPGEEILVAESTEDALGIIRMATDGDLARIADAARRRVLAEHTAERRCEQLEAEVGALVGSTS